MSVWLWLGFVLINISLLRRNSVTHISYSTHTNTHTHIDNWMNEIGRKSEEANEKSLRIMECFISCFSLLWYISNKKDYNDGAGLPLCCWSAEKNYANCMFQLWDAAVDGREKKNIVAKELSNKCDIILRLHGRGVCQCVTCLYTAAHRTTIQKRRVHF